jgi:ribosomal protein S12 methylthiotransferase
MTTISRGRRAQLPVLPAMQPATATAAGVEPAAGAPRIGLVTLGCDKNTVDSERLLARLAGAGAHVAVGADDVDVGVINTCGFSDVAKEESIEAILDAVRLKADGHVQAVVAMGCMVQRYRDDLAREIPEVDLFLGLTEADRLVPELRSRGLLRTVATMEQPLRLLATSTQHTSYLKISEGCDHACAFCAIPLMRGRHRSTPIDVLLREARELEAGGVVELNIISQDTTWYGRDIVRGTAGGADEWFVGRSFAGMRGPLSQDATRVAPVDAARVAAARGRGARHGLLPELLRGLLDGTDIPWLRLFYMYPSGIHRELVELMAREPRIVPYLDMPIQHGADAVLARMRRPERQATIRQRVSWLRDAIPDLALRTTVIVGFPGETDDDFDVMLELLEEIRFDHLGAFAYSIEEDTAAASMPDQVPAAVKRERLERLQEVQRGIAQERSEAWLGREVTVLVDEVTGRDIADGGAPARGAVGRTARQALEVDGGVHIEAAPHVQPGEFVRARLVDVIENDFGAELL